MTTCSKCRRPLTDPLSISLGMGPTCRGELRRGKRQQKTEQQLDIFGGQQTMTGSTQPAEPQLATLKSTRPVMIMERVYDGDNREFSVVDKQAGEFHCFGANFMEFESGPGNFTVAIVELPDGTVEAILPTLIRFLDVPR